MCSPRVDLGVAESRVGVLGANSLVGGCLLPLLREAGWRVGAFSRQTVESGAGVAWRRLPLTEGVENIPHWISVAPIWVLPDYLAMIEASGARRLVTLSSTSQFRKVGSGDTADIAIAAKLIDGEARVQAWAESCGVEWVILRPTLIYGLGRDKNISEITRLIRLFRFFPVLGRAQGLRQPIHAEDVAAACVSALEAPDAANRAYNISGGDTLTYREMVARVFHALSRRPRLLAVPLWVFRLVLAVLRLLPRYRQWSPAMVERMNLDFVFDHTNATRDLKFIPRPFQLTPEDLPN